MRVSLAAHPVIMRNPSFIPVLPMMRQPDDLLPQCPLTLCFRIVSLNDTLYRTQALPRNPTDSQEPVNSNTKWRLLAVPARRISAPGVRLYPLQVRCRRHSSGTQLRSSQSIAPQSPTPCAGMPPEGRHVLIPIGPLSAFSDLGVPDAGRDGLPR